MFSEFSKTIGQLTLTLRDKDGVIKQQSTVPNMIVFSGKEFITASMAKTVTNNPPAMSHMALGTGNVAPITGNTTLMTEFSGGSNSRSALVTTTTNNVITYEAVFAAGNCTGPIVEAGIFNASTGGTMLCRTVFAVYNKDVSDSLTISWNITNI